MFGVFFGLESSSPNCSLSFLAAKNYFQLKLTSFCRTDISQSRSSMVKCIIGLVQSDFKSMSNFSNLKHRICVSGLVQKNLTFVLI